MSDHTTGRRATTKQRPTDAQRALRRLSATNRGKWLETIVSTSQGDQHGRVVCLDKMHASAIFKRGGEVGLGKGPVDFVGEFVATGRALHFDAKESQDETGFDIGYCLKTHQREWLLRHGEAKAVAGVLVACHHMDTFMWLDWRHLVTNPASLSWTSLLWVYLGHTKKTIDFRKLGVLMHAIPIG